MGEVEESEIEGILAIEEEEEEEEKSRGMKKSKEESLKIYQ